MTSIIPVMSFLHDLRRQLSSLSIGVIGEEMNVGNQFSFSDVIVLSNKASTEFGLSLYKIGAGASGMSCKFVPFELLY